MLRVTGMVCLKLRVVQWVRGAAKFRGCLPAALRCRWPVPHPWETSCVTMTPGDGPSPANNMHTQTISHEPGRVRGKYGEVGTCSSSAMATRAGPAAVRTLGGWGITARYTMYDMALAMTIAGRAAVTATVSSLARMILSSSIIAASRSVFILCTCTLPSLVQTLLPVSTVSSKVMIHAEIREEVHLKRT